MVFLKQESHRSSTLPPNNRPTSELLIENSNWPRNRIHSFTLESESIIICCPGFYCWWIFVIGFRTWHMSQVNKNGVESQQFQRYRSWLLTTLTKVIAKRLSRFSLYILFDWIGFYFLSGRDGQDERDRKAESKSLAICYQKKMNSKKRIRHRTPLKF